MLPNPKNMESAGWHNPAAEDHSARHVTSGLSGGVTMAAGKTHLSDR
jgi:hypothetical protein